MRDLIRGTVRDHRLPSDYNFHFNQPLHSRTFLKALKRFLLTRHITKQNITLPLYGIFGFFFPFFCGFTLYNYLRTGHLSSTLQPQNLLYRKGWYGLQNAYNGNPDNFFNSNMNCWSSDPNCGVDVGPKRPWEDLKKPEEVLVKFGRDATQHQRTKVDGWRGF